MTGVRRAHFLSASVLLMALAFVAVAAVAKAVVIVPFGSSWEYTTTDPTADPNWDKTTGTPGWNVGDAPFSNLSSGDLAYQTQWTSTNLWVRKSVDLTGYDLTSLVYDIKFNKAFKLYLNGTLIGMASTVSSTQEIYGLSVEYADIASVVQPGVNVFAIVMQGNGSTNVNAFDWQLSADPVVPEPATMALVGIGLSAAGVLRFRRKKTA